jgi:DnaJ-class molecular chaperone
MDELINEYEAALLTNMSPTLLRWLTTYAPKKDKVKLNFIEKNGLYFYNKTELLNFDRHLNSPWQKPPKGQRPRIPDGIKVEIKTEAHFCCPICHSNNNCEIAHIKPVAKSLNNHPHNLIFLCPNHHSEYDYGYRFNNVNEDIINHFKKTLQIFQTICWSMQNSVVTSYLQIINKIGRVKEIETEIPSISKQEDFKLLFENFVLKLEKVETVKPTKSSKRIEQIIHKLKEEKPTPKSSNKDFVYNFLSVKEEIKHELENDDNLIKCPLCLGNGSTSHFDICPVCDGNAYIDKEVEIDLSPYNILNCELCKGRGTTSFFDVCPPCGGEGQLTRQQIDSIDFNQYELEECPLCKGRGTTSAFEVCPPCGGEGQLTREQIYSIDFDQYELEDCPLCKGRGITSAFEACPPCGGEGQLTREQIDSIDFDQYELEDCPLCKGRGTTSAFEVCPPCGGEGQMTRKQIDSIDFDQYELEDCPLCKGRGTTSAFEVCPPCGGEGQLTREQIENIDFDQYD